MNLKISDRFLPSHMFSTHTALNWSKHGPRNQRATRTSRICSCVVEIFISQWLTINQQVFSPAKNSSAFQGVCKNSLMCIWHVRLFIYLFFVKRKKIYYSDMYNRWSLNILVTCEEALNFQLQLLGADHWTRIGCQTANMWRHKSSS